MMPRCRGRAGVAAFALLLSAAAPAVAGGGPLTYEYPSLDCPRQAGLQACIDGVAEGDIIVLVDEINDEGAGIDKSLTLRAVDDSLQPQLQGILIGDGGPGSTIEVTLEDIVVTGGINAVFFDEGSDHRLSFRRLRVGLGSPFASGIQVAASMPMTVIVEDSIVRTVDQQGNAIGIDLAPGGGASSIRIIGNRVHQKGASESSSGVDVDLVGTGAVDVDILSNSVFDVARSNTGSASGIFLGVDGRLLVDADVVGNTVARSATAAFDIRSDLSGSGRLRLDLFNNTFSHSRSGITLDSNRVTLRAGRNNTFHNTQGNGFDGLPRGDGDRSVDPRFVKLATGDLRLTAASPLIDAAWACAPGGVASRDAYGHARLAGPTVDIGAHERDAGPPAGVVRLGGGGANTLVGTAGPDILCGFGGADRLDGKGGPDHLDGGAGPDRLLGGGGPDQLCSRDGSSGDRADGGAGRDGASTDAGDTRVSIERTRAC